MPSKELKLFVRLPAILFIVLVVCEFGLLAFGLWHISLLMESTETVQTQDTIYAVIYICMNGFLFITLFIIQFCNKYSCTINAEGIFIDFFNIYKKELRWNSRIYYMVTNSYFKLFDYKKMLPLEKEIIFNTNIKHGQISLKSEKALKTQVDNKDWIIIWTRWLKGNVQVKDIVDVINEFRKSLNTSVF